MAIERLRRFNELDPDVEADQAYARRLKTMLSGPTCPSGHSWQKYGLLQKNRRIRCIECRRLSVLAAARKRRALETLAGGDV